MDDDYEDIKRLHEIIKAENAQQDFACDTHNFFSSDSSDSDESEDEVDVKPSKLPTEVNVPNDFKTDLNPSNEISSVCSDLSSIIPHLSYEEFDIINNCEDPKLKNLLILNRTKKLQLKSLIANYYNLLTQCSKNLKYEHDLNKRKKEIATRKQNYYLVGMPYFRDAKNYACPLNSDSIIKKQKGEINFDRFRTKYSWSINKQINLKSTVMLNYFKYVLNKYEQKLAIASLEDEFKVEEINSKIKELKENFDTTAVPKFWCDDGLDWRSISISVWDDVTFEYQCKSFWNLYVHPHINKKPFDEKENLKIIELVKKYSCQNWEKISEHLENRSSYLICVHYFTKLLERSTPVYRFSKAEVDYLLETIENLRTGCRIPWNRVSLVMNRTREQVYARYKYSVSTSNIKSGPFTEAEDVMILCLIKKYGENYDAIKTHMPHRKQIQIKNRYRDYLQHNEVQLGNWTVIDDEMILDHVSQHGPKSWALLAEKMKRTSAHLRHRYNVLNKHMKEGKSLSDLPRRTHKFKNRKNIIKSVQHYLETDSLPSIEFSADNKSSGRPLRNFIDDELVNFFKTTAQVRKVRKLRSVTDEALEKCANSIQSVLNLLGVTLTIPKDLSDTSLTVIDKEILNILQQKQGSTHNKEIVSVLPPNINTIQALRCLLLKYQEYSKNCKKIENINSNDMELIQFEERFRALFQWPCIMSITEPAEKPVEEKPTEVKEPVKKIVKPKGRPKKNISKVHLMNAARLAKLAKAPKDGQIEGNTIDSLPTTSTAKRSLSEGIINSVPIKSVEQVEEMIQTLKQITNNKKEKYLIKIDKATIEKMQKKNGQKLIIKTMQNKRTSDEVDGENALKKRKLDTSEPSTSGLQ